jgi:alkylhydroperoxidase/carboxymuconolactone decarboxylase family protein YurZ
LDVTDERHEGIAIMADELTGGRKAFGDIAPALLELTDEVLFGEVWERPGLSKRDRSLITVAALVAGYQEPQASQSLALKREATIKAMSRLEKESLIRQAG